uniref:Acrosin n=1 Tax=Pseudonaja textilis TaxID=8673 RepID=A0A670ZMM7_PSETE
AGCSPPSCQLSPPDHSPFVLLFSGVCGRRPLAASHTLLRIVGGTDALPGTWPWQVCFQIPSQLGYINACGGTLLSARWVLTAAHCFHDISWYRVVLGLNRISQPGPDAQNRLIKRVINHKLYKNELNSTDGGIRHDISLVELTEPVRCNDYIQPACLPDKSTTISKLTQCSISGWGTMESMGLRKLQPQRRPDVMQEGVVKLIPFRTCSSLTWWNKRVRPENICAGHESGELSTCQGDSGGPLMCREERSERYWVIGVTSWGPMRCSEVRKIFTRLLTSQYWLRLGLLPPIFPSLTPGPMVPPSSQFTSRPRLPPQYVPGFRPYPKFTPGYRPPPSSRFTVGPRPPPFPRFTPAARPPPTWKPSRWYFMPATPWYLLPGARPPKWGTMTPSWRRTHATRRPWTGPALWGMTLPLRTTPRKWFYRTRAPGRFRVTWASRQLQLQPNQKLSPPGHHVSHNWNPSLAQPGSQSRMLLPPSGPERG